MVTPAREYVTPEEYLARERAAETKSEYYGGHIFAMADGSEEHNLICSNLVRLLGNQLAPRGCRTYTSDMRVLVEESGLYTYPDVTVVCGKPQFASDRHDTLVNPLVVVEVVSPSSREYDRGYKAEMYRSRESLRAYVIVEQDRRYVEVHTRGEAGAWLLTSAREPDAAIWIPPIDCVLRLEEVYAQVELPEQTPLRSVVPERRE